MDEGSSRGGASLSLSLREHYEGNLEGDFLTGDPGRYV